ncbi:MAG TPA: hypothetical protein VK911_06960 [Vicinamibacterales bacterium]|nr:hypothetical protein [Vicinamibacterales bacterium]
MRIYLIAYFLVVAAAGFVLWQAGVLERLPLGWVALSLLAAIGLGTLLALVSRRRV